MYIAGFVFIRSVVVLLWVDIRNYATIVIGGVDIVSRLWVILHLPCIPRLDRGRPS
jgi:hypothetical protein